MTSYTNSNEKDWQDVKDKINYLKDMVDPRYLIESLGFLVTRETSKEIRAACKIHGGDNTTGFRFNKEKRSWVCFTRRCHEVFGSDIIALIRSVNSVGFTDAVGYLEKLCGYVESDRKRFLRFKRIKERDSFIDQNNDSDNKAKAVSEKRLLGYRSVRSNKFGSDGFSEGILNAFEIGGGYVDDDKLIRDVIPIRDPEGELVAYSLRDIREGISYDKKYILTYGFNKDKIIYNLNKAKKFASDKPLIVVEGFKSVWRLAEYGIHNVVAIMGSTITSGQINILCSYALKGVVIMFDNDQAGVVGALKSYEAINNKFPTDIIFITETDDKGNGLDPADLTREQALDYLKRYI